MTESLFLSYSVRKLRQLQERIAECVGRLTDEQVWARHSDAENAAGNLLLHLSGNVRQWIVSGIGGQADRRTRDQEFAAQGGLTRQELLSRLAETLDEAVAVMESLPPRRLAETIRPQNYDVSVLEAIYHVVEHFSMHTGQIIFATKLLTGRDLGFYAHLSGKAEKGHPVP